MLNNIFVSYASVSKSFRVRVLLAAAAFLVFGSFTPDVLASQTDINGPAGSDTFGTTVTVLPNGNFVVVDRAYTDPANPGETNIGAGYLYDGVT